MKKHVVLIAVGLVGLALFTLSATMRPASAPSSTADDCHCTYEGKSYSVGSTVCQGKTLYECDGQGGRCQWFDTGKSCK